MKRARKAAPVPVPLDSRPAPPIPKALWSPLGPVKVRVVKRLPKSGYRRNPEADDFGYYDPARRVIRLRSTLDRWAMWQTLRHEWVHMVVFDGGFHNAMNDDLIEGVCDLIGTALVAEMRHQ